MIIKKNRLRLVITVCLTLTIGLIPGFVSLGQANAAGDAYFSFSPSSGSYTIGSTLNVTVSETSSSDNTNGVQVNMSYPTALLRYQNMSLNGPFTIPTQETGGNGSIAIGCAAISAQSGNQTVATITFTALASGTAAVNMIAGNGVTTTNIVNTSGNSVWNGNLPTASFTLAAAPTKPPTTTKSTTSTKSTTTTPQTTTTTPTTTSPSTTTTTTTPTTQALGSLSVTVTNGSGQKVTKAKVVLDNNKVVYTNQNGVANFAGVSSGSHSVTITDHSKKPTTNKLTLAAGQNELVSYELISNPVASTSLILIIGGILTIIILGNIGYWKLFRPRTPKNPTDNKPINPTVTVNSDNAAKPLNPSDTISATSPTNSAPIQNLPPQFQPSTDPSYGSITSNKS